MHRESPQGHENPPSKGAVGGPHSDGGTPAAAPTQAYSAQNRSHTTRHARLTPRAAGFSETDAPVPASLGQERRRGRPPAAEPKKCLGMGVPPKPGDWFWGHDHPPCFHPLKRGGGCVRRRPTLPHTPVCSTIGAVRLSFRVRNGTGRFPHAMTTETILSCSSHTFVRVGDPTNRCGLLFQISYSGRKHRRFFVACRSPVFGDVTSPRPISTSQLHILLCFHVWPINPMVFGGPYPLKVVRVLILKHASRLDAFSGYHFPT